MRTIATLTCDGCDWGYCTDQVRREPFGWLYPYPDPHVCPNGGEEWERVEFDAELRTTQPGYWARVII